MSKQQTPIDWLIQTLESDIKVDESNMVIIKIHEHDYIKSKQVALEMEKEQIDGAYSDGWMSCEKWFADKELDDHIGDANEMIKISDESWEGCDGCTEQDEIMYKNGYVKGYNSAISELPKEISDEEIEEQSWGYREVTKDMEIPPNEDWSNGAKWYREQLKNK